MIMEALRNIVTRNDPLAQLVEHLTFNQGVWRSSRQWVTKYMRS